MKLIACLTVLLAVTYSSPVAEPQGVALESINRENLMPILQGDGTIGFVEVSDAALEATTVGASLSDVTYYLYTRSNRNSPNIIKNGNINQVKSSRFSKNKVTVFISHGWNNNYKSDVNTKVTSAILDTYDVNVFVVDWGGIAHKDYLTAKNAVPQIGKYEAQFIKSIQSAYGLNGNNFILIGHSLGAHVAGCAGAALGGSIHTIIGLDPAGPMYVAWNTANRIDKTDGQFVHIIHTCGNLLGYFDPMGHADYYPNGGKKSQPGCGLDLKGDCSHGRSYEFLAESIRSNKAFIGRKCSNYGQFEKGSCNRNSASAMGGIYVDRKASGTYYLTTNASPPYGRH